MTQERGTTPMDPAATEYENAEHMDAPVEVLDETPVEVVVTGPVTVVARTPRTITTDQVPVSEYPGQILNAVFDRAQVTLKAVGGSAAIGSATVTYGTGYVLDAGESITLTTRSDVWAVATASGVTIHVLAEHHQG